MKKYLLSSLFYLLFVVPVVAAPRPRLVVNIVVGGMRYDYLARFGDNLDANGFARLLNRGVVCTNARYDFSASAPATLGTIVAGANPTVHGIVGREWVDIVSGSRVNLIADRTTRGLDGEGSYSYVNQLVETVGDGLRNEQPKAKVIAIAVDPTAAIVLGGRRGEAYWVDEVSCQWITSNRYMPTLPGWVKSYNSRSYERGGIYQRFEWIPLLPVERYVNSRYSVVNPGGKLGQLTRMNDAGHYPTTGKRYSATLATPVSSDLTVDFVRQVIMYSGLGKDEIPDILNIYFDNLRTVGEQFGPESIELEDALYRLDRNLASMFHFIEAQYGERVLFVLTSDGGISSSFDREEQRDRFNNDQFRIIANSFLSAQYGSGNWVLGCENRNVYLNRPLVQRMGLNFDEVCERFVSFATQFRGVANVFTGATLQNAGFSDPLRRRIQNGYCPTRSGDIILNFSPGWIEVSEGVRAASGSPYDYDVHVPLIFYGGGLSAGTITRNIDMTSLAIVEADIMDISRPEAAMGDTLPEIVEKLR